MSDLLLNLVEKQTREVAVAAGWHAVGEWLDEVRLNGGDYSQATANTYAFHVAKLRWYCDRIGVPPVYWTRTHVNDFVAFLRNLPPDCLCAKVETGRKRPGADGVVEPITRFVKPGEPGYTPFRTVPAAGSRDDILRCVRALFQHLHDEGKIRRNPLAKVKTRTSRNLDTERFVDLDLYRYALDYLDALPLSGANVSRAIARDRFVFVALRELGLRASELVGVRMGDVEPLTDAKSARTYWILRVRAEYAKGGKARDVPLTRAVFEELMAYRKAFGLPPAPERGETYGLLLSLQTRPAMAGESMLKGAGSRRYFRSWASLSSRKSLYLIVKSRLDDVAIALDAAGRGTEAAQLKAVSPHWLRHTFAKALIAKGRDIRVVAQSLGHASVTTTMAYTRQSALDQIREYERDGGDDMAVQ